MTAPLPFRARLGLNAAPLFLRFLLAACFLYAGITKITASFPTSTEQAATLAALGLGDAANPPKTLRALHGVSLSLYAASHPATDAAGKKPMPLWPAALGEGQWPVRLAWAVTLTEIGGGAFILLGLLTRLAALGIAGVMLGAAWLTQFGPAIQSGKTTLGFLPAHDTFDATNWATFWLQLSLLAMSLALALLGPGRLSVDHALFTPPRRDDDGE
ncbi:MAG: DoxX family protein [Phycisphaerae bacterium]|nr:DoxX family protein [Phycisphaerae bacterium]